MAQTYTYEDFEKALRTSGLDSQFSTADLALAKRNPDAGMSLLSYKQDYANATTDEMRALANSGAESIRQSFGEYSGGTDGSGFYSTALSPGSFTADTAPTYEDKYADTLEDLVAQNLQRESYSYDKEAPVYESIYGDTISGLVSDLLNREEFSYDHTSDPLYSSYAKQYTREGKRATADALGEAASATGGIPSSYAVTAATQAGDYYASQLADKIPELYQIAYDKYLNEYNMKLSDLSAVQGLEEFEYGKYQDQLGQYNTDRNFDYAAWLDDYEMQQQNIDTIRALQNDDYNRYLTELGQYNTDRSFNYAQLLDEIDSQTAERSEAYDKAQIAAEYGDFSYLDELGITRNAENIASERAEQYELAQLAAKYGDYSRLRALGINPVVETDSSGTASDTVSGSSSALDEASAAGSVPDSVLSQLAAQYPDGVIDDNDALWNWLVSEYGEDALAEAGYSNGETAAGTVEELYTELSALINALRSGEYDDIKTADDVWREIQNWPGYSSAHHDAIIESYLNGYRRKYENTASAV